MKKCIITFIIIFIVATGIYFISGLIFNAAGNKIISKLQPQLKNQGISLENYDFKYIRFSSLRTVSVYDFHSIITLQLSSQNNKSYSTIFYAEKINFHLKNLKPTALTVSCSNFRMYVENASDIPRTSFARFNQGYVKLAQPIVLSQPLSGLKSELQNINNLFDEEKINSNLIIRAQVTIKLGNKNAQAYLYTVQEKGQTSLQFKKEDIINMADTFTLQISDEEAAIIAQYPLRTTRILQITMDAKTTSRKVKKGNRSVPEDAYRHVLWSYLLTKEFEPDFAEQVTDAHETLPTNTPAQRAMDFHNNRIGRNYALQGVSRDKILWLVINDKNVIRSPKRLSKKS